MIKNSSYLSLKTITTTTASKDQQNNDLLVAPQSLSAVSSHNSSKTSLNYRNSGASGTSGGIGGGCGDSVVSIKHYDSLLGELRCPGCAHPMLAPIRLCTNGHSICDKCTNKLLECPLCKGNLTETRSVTLEALAAKAYFTCSNISNGCAVRLPMELMKWHEERCLYNVGSCFMGKVYNDCEWSGCKIDWLDHCIEKHNDKIYTVPEGEFEWDYHPMMPSKPVVGYYIFQVFNETFNLYHIYDKPDGKLTWTMICASQDSQLIKQRFSYEIEIFIPNDSSKLLIQRYSCHAERDEDVLARGKCATINLSSAFLFMGREKVLHYRIKILELELNKNLQLVPKNYNFLINKTNSLPYNYNLLTENNCNNLKNVPNEQIITKKKIFVNKNDDDDDEGGGGGGCGDDVKLIPEIEINSKKDDEPNEINNNDVKNDDNNNIKNNNNNNDNDIDYDLYQNIDNLKRIFEREFQNYNNRNTIPKTYNCKLIKPPRLSKSKTNINQQYEMDIIIPNTTYDKTITK